MRRKTLPLIFFVIFLNACSDKQEQNGRPPSHAIYAPHESKQKNISEEAPGVEFALECLSQSTPKRKAIFVSLGKSAMFTNFTYKNQYSLNLINASPESYEYRVNNEFTGTKVSSLADTTISINRETLKLLYIYKESYGSGVDPFFCEKARDPLQAHEQSKQLLIDEVKRVNDAAENNRIEKERVNEAQLKRNKI